MFIGSICPLLPVSMAEMPSIMMLFWLTPPNRVPPAEVPSYAFTPGVKATRLVKFPRTTGRLSICLVVMANDRSPLIV